MAVPLPGERDHPRKRGEMLCPAQRRGLPGEGTVVPSAGHGVPTSIALHPGAGSKAAGSREGAAVWTLSSSSLGPSGPAAARGVRWGCQVGQPSPLMVSAPGNDQ